MRIKKTVFSANANISVIREVITTCIYKIKVLASKRRPRNAFVPKYIYAWYSPTNMFPFLVRYALCVSLCSTPIMMLYPDVVMRLSPCHNPFFDSQLQRPESRSTSFPTSCVPLTVQEFLWLSYSLSLSRLRHEYYQVR